MSRLRGTGLALSSSADPDALPQTEERAWSCAPAGAVEAALRALLPVRDRLEVERLTVELVAEVSGARWVALYRQAAVGGELRAAYPASPPPVPAALTVGAGEAGDPAKWCATLAGLEPPTEVHVALQVHVEEEGWALVVLGPHAAGLAYGEEHLEEVRRLVEGCGVALGNAHVLESLRSLVFVDPLTGCYNRRGMEEHLRVEMVRALRYRRPLSLLLLDLDHFKRINDVLGHAMGDHALRRVGETLQTAFRATDLACRFGGDEFLVIFPETPKHEVLRLAERLRVKVSSLLPDATFPDSITVSLGVAAYPDDAADPGDLLSVADRALYRAKADGRDRVRHT